MKKNNPIWILAIIAIFLLVILNLVFSIKSSDYKEKLNSLGADNPINVSLEKTETGEECPDAKGGSENAFLQIKYFYSKFCPWCVREEPILQKIAKEYGNIAHIEWFDINNCPEITGKYEVSGVPTLVFSTINNQTEYSHYGFVYEKDLMKLMCDVTGGC